MNDVRRATCDLTIAFFVKTQLRFGQVCRKGHDAFACSYPRDRESLQYLSRRERCYEPLRRMRVVIGTTEAINGHYFRISEEFVEYMSPKEARDTRQDDLMRKDDKHDVDDLRGIRYYAPLSRGCWQLNDHWRH